MDLANQFLAFIGWQSAFAIVIALCVWPFAKAFGRRSSYLVILLWSIVLLRLILPTGLASEYSLRSFVDWALSSEVSVEEVAAFENPVISEVVSEGVMSVTTSTKKASIHWMFWAWLIGFVSCVTFFAYLRRPFRRLIKQSQPVTCRDTLDFTEKLRGSLKISRLVNVRIASSSVPFTVGFIRPIIILPKELFKEGKQSVIECILTHEMHHVRHWDALWLYLQEALQCVYFFNPIVWYANASIHRARECLRDSQALRNSNITKRSYGESLLYFSINCNSSYQRYKPYPAFAGSQNQLKRRIEYMVKQKDTKMKNTLVFLAVCLIAFILIPLAPLSTHAAAADPPLFVEDVSYFSPIKEGRISSSFGKRMNPFTKKLQQHKGVDVAAPIGTPVFAIADGTVLESEMHEAYGNLIKVRHDNNRESWYSQLNERNVEKGDKVSRGQTIATVGSSGRSTGPHLHFEFRIDGSPVDPEVHVPLYHLPKSNKADDDC